MEIVTNWMERGMEQGSLQEARSLIKRQLPRRVGELSVPVIAKIDALSVTQLETLAEVLLDFSALSDLETWLVEQEQV
ncbi:MAG: DUF4351 domain-containing protein [Cyanobacteria bacterium J06626_18]